MRKICLKMVSKLLNDDQKDCCMEMCQDVLNHLQNEPDVLGRVITGDETYIFEYDLESMSQSSQW